MINVNVGLHVGEKTYPIVDIVTGIVKFPHFAEIDLAASIYCGYHPCEETFTVELPVNGDVVAVFRHTFAALDRTTLKRF